MLLYEHPLSCYARKVKIALRGKGVAFALEVPEWMGKSGGIEIVLAGLRSRSRAA